MKRMQFICAVLMLTLSAITGASEYLITFVCTGNTGRSPMAEAISNDLINRGKLDLKVQSRGVHINQDEIRPEKGTFTVLQERGLDISNHKATQLTEKDVKNSYLILTMTEIHKNKILSQYPQAKSKVFSLYEYTTGVHENLSDPYGKPLKAYRDLEAQLDKLLPITLDKASKRLK